MIKTVDISQLLSGSKEEPSTSKATVTAGPSHTASPSQIIQNLTKSSGLVVKTVKVKKEESTTRKSICRVCLKRGDIPIYVNKQITHICRDLKVIGGINLKFEDLLPKHMCRACYELLKSAIAFRRMAQRSDRMLRQSSTNIKEEKALVGLKVPSGRFDNQKVHANVIKRESLKVEPDLLDDGIQNDDDNSIETYNKLSVDDVTKHIMVNEEDKDKKAIKIKYKIIDEKAPEKMIKGKPNKKEKKIFHCNSCDINFDSFIDFKEHRRLEDHRSKKVSCPYCGQMYNQEYLKRIHLPKHTYKEGKYMCDICGKKFMLEKTLIGHRLAHNNEYPFKCTLCNYRGRFKEYLKTHMRTHTEKQFRCPHCPDRLFINKSNLSRHILIAHTSEREFKCDECGKGFYTKRELMIHIKVNHRGILEHACSICGKLFGHKDTVRRHELKVHKRERMQKGRTPKNLEVTTQDGEF